LSNDKTPTKEWHDRRDTDSILEGSGHPGVQPHDFVQLHQTRIGHKGSDPRWSSGNFIIGPPGGGIMTWDEFLSLTVEELINRRPDVQTLCGQLIREMQELKAKLHIINGILPENK